MLVYKDGGIVIRDLGSSNGTFVNGLRVSQANAAVGSLLRFGDVTIDVLDRRPDERAIAGDDVETPVRRPGNGAPAGARLVYFPPQRKRVLNLLLNGLAEKQVAALLGLSYLTVHWHVGEIYKSLGVHSRAQLSAYFRHLEEDGNGDGNSDLKRTRSASEREVSPAHSPMLRA